MGIQSVEASRRKSVTLEEGGRASKKAQRAEATLHLALWGSMKESKRRG